MAVPTTYADIETFKKELQLLEGLTREDFLAKVKFATITDITPYNIWRVLRNYHSSRRLD